MRRIAIFLAATPLAAQWFDAPAWFRHEFAELAVVYSNSQLQVESVAAARLPVALFAIGGRLYGHTGWGMDSAVLGALLLVRLLTNEPLALGVYHRSFHTLDAPRPKQSAPSDDGFAVAIGANPVLAWGWGTRSRLWGEVTARGELPLGLWASGRIFFAERLLAASARFGLTTAWGVVLFWEATYRGRVLFSAGLAVRGK